MTPDEFDQWLDHHAGMYPGVKRWLAKPENEGVEAAWERLLSRTSLEAAKRASMELFEQDEQPRGFGEHPRAVKRLAWELRPKQQVARKIDGQDTFRCLRCRDSGVVSVVNPATLRAVWRDHESHGVRWCAVACDCEAGDHFVAPPKGVRPLGRWDQHRPLFSFEEVYEHARTIDQRDPVRATWEAIKQLLEEHDAARTRGQTLEEVQFAAPYPGS